MKMNRIRTIRLLVLLIVLGILIFAFPQNVFFIIFVVYAFSGFIMLIGRVARKKQINEFEETGDHEEYI
jgi:Flp pilus assembly protein TadB